MRVFYHSVHVAGGMRQLHWHLNFDEWQYVINVSTEQYCCGFNPHVLWE